jgi:hypothetical protein
MLDDVGFRPSTQPTLYLFMSNIINAIATLIKPNKYILLALFNSILLVSSLIQPIPILRVI